MSFDVTATDTTGDIEDKIRAQGVDATGTFLMFRQRILFRHALLRSVRIIEGATVKMQTLDGLALETRLRNSGRRWLGRDRT